MNMAGVEGFEPPTPGFGIRCSTNWSYTPGLSRKKRGLYTPFFYFAMLLLDDFRNNTRTNSTPTFADRET